MKNYFKLIIFVILTIFISNCSKNSSSYTIAFYNLENLFDTVNDIEKDSTYIDDVEFTPESKKEWNSEKLDKKMSNISKIVRIMNEGTGPDILGFCESENKNVAFEMFNKYLQDMNYKMVYYESDDSRGIDVGLVFKEDRLKLIESKPLKIESVKNTRDILYSKLLVNEDTLNIFVNHWPSRRGGEKESENNRIYAASVLKKQIDEILHENNDSKIIIMGDFNDYPDNNSILNVLQAKPFLDCSQSDISILNNLSYKLFNEKKGTYFYQGNFNMLDQMIVSKSLLNNSGLTVRCNSFQIIQNEINKTFSGKYKDAPFPTYAGDRYLGGYSDHFPVLIELIYK